MLIKLKINRDETRMVRAALVVAMNCQVSPDVQATLRKVVEQLDKKCGWRLLVVKK